MTDPEEVKRLIGNNPWATFVSATSNGLVASHYPVLLDESATDITVLSHFGRPDDELHELGQHQMRGPSSNRAGSCAKHRAPLGRTPSRRRQVDL